MVSITASSMAGVVVALFFYGGEVAETRDVEVITVEASGWEQAASKMAMELNASELQLGQVWLAQWPPCPTRCWPSTPRTITPTPPPCSAPPTAVRCRGMGPCAWTGSA